MPRDRFAFAGLGLRHDAEGPAVPAEMVLRTSQRFAIVDLTAEVAERVIAAGVRTGVAHVHTSHTTTALVLNEKEPLLLQDLRRTLERLVPDGTSYAHDDIVRRGAAPDEPRNGAAHCRALLLPSSQCLPIREGRLALGRWQSLFLVELDGPRRRTLRLTLTGR